MKLRTLAASDTSEIYALDQRCFAPGIAYSQTEVGAYLRLPGFHAGCEDEQGRLMGVLLSVRQRGYGHVITIDVDAGARRRGIGQQLMQAAEAHFREHGARGMRLEAAVNNTAALAFYARLGYQVTRTLPGYYALDLDGLQLERLF